MYPMLNKNRLRLELTDFYESDDFRNIAGAIRHLQLIYKSNLENVFHEVATLLRISVTIPNTTAVPERLSSLKRIKTFLRNSMTQDHLTAHTMISIEKQSITNMRVLDKFVCKESRKVEFNFHDQHINL
jgi:hypothetical protein